MSRRTSFAVFKIFAALCFMICSCPASAGDVIADAGRFTVKIVSAIAYPFEQEFKGTAAGAGFLADRERGWILTNAHVAGRSPSSVQISFNGYPFEKAGKFYMDNHLDVAVLAIEPSRIPPQAIAGPLQCATEYAPGRPVIAFGHPWSFDYTATRGIISGITDAGGVGVLQTDAALNPGNSGGPLIDAETGSIIGINMASLRATPSEGLHFAVPIKLVCTILDLLKQGKEPAPPVLPVSFATALENNELIVAKVQEEWSQKFQIGDRILAVDGDRSSRNVSRVLDHMRGKDRVTFTIERDTREQEVAVDVPREKDLMKRRGVQVSGMTIGQRFIPEGKPNEMYIHFIDGASIADQAAFNPGDQVTSIDGILAEGFDAVFKTLKDRSGKEAEFVVKRERPPTGSRRYDYLVLQLLVKDVFEVTERGPKP
ncbi:MAG: trypsin-like peptidase domain-containing protein [Rhodomicrobium sp.]